MAKAGSMRKGALSCMETCEVEMVAAPPKGAGSWLCANMKLWPVIWQSRGFCSGLMVVLVRIMHP